MITVTPRHPGVSPSAEVDTLADLFALPWIKSWTTLGPLRWMRSTAPDHALLIAVFATDHWVVAFVRPPDALDSLPEWKSPTPPADYTTAQERVT